MAENDDIAPCPFCGESDADVRSDEFRVYTVYCLSCGADGPESDIGDKVAGAIKLWNRRLPPP